MRPTPQWGIRWNPDQGWEVVGPKPKPTNLDYKMYHVVVPLFMGEYHHRKNVIALREQLLLEIKKGNDILTEDCDEGERIEKMGQWLQQLAKRFKPTSQEYSEIEKGIYPGAWGHTE